VSVRIAVASVAVTGLVLLAVWVTDLSFERAVLLAPVLVLGGAALAGLLVFWGKVAWESLSQTRHPRLLIAAGTAFVLLLVALSLLGVNLPHE
jgi:hypothetical protein